MAAPLPPPSLQQALVVALLLRRRSAAADSARAQLEGELEALRAAAAAQPPPQPPQPLLAALVDLPAAGGAAASPAAAPPLPSEEAVQQQSEVVALWHHAAAALPPHLRPALAQAQRYLLLAELRQPSSSSGALPLAAALEHRPVQALLELSADILQAHAAAAAAPPPQQQQQQQPTAPATPLQLSSAHGQLLGAACEALVHLCERPGETAAPPDYQLLQQFGQMLLHEVAAPEQPATAGMHPAAAAALPAPAPVAAAAGAAVDLQQPSSAVAVAMLAVLRQSPHAGLTLLGCCAPAVRDSMAALVEVVNAEGPGLLLPPSSDVGSAAASSGAHLGGGGGAAAAAAEEARLLHAFTQLGHQLSAGLRLLPAWLKAADIAADAFLQDTAVAVVAARDLGQLVSVTHPAAARHMQRVHAQMVGALREIAADDQHMHEG